MINLVQKKKIIVDNKNTSKFRSWKFDYKSKIKVHTKTIKRTKKKKHDLELSGTKYP